MKAACLPMLLWALRLLTLAGGQPKAFQRCREDCNISRKKLLENLVRSYYEIDPSCRENVTVFVTVKSREICADSNEGWVKKIKDKLDGKSATVMPPRGVTPAEEPSGIERHVGLPELAQSQTTAPASFFQGTGTTLREGGHAPAATTEGPSKPPLGRQEPPQLPAGSSPVAQEGAVGTPEAKGEPSHSPASSAAAAAGGGSRQPTPLPTGQDTASPNSNPHLMAAARGSNQPELGSLDPTRANTPHAASSSSRSDLPSIWDSMKTTTVTDTAPQTTSVPTLSSTTAIDRAASVGPSAGTATFDHSLPVGKQEPSDRAVFTHQRLSSQARVQMITVRPNNLPLPSFLSKSQMHFVIPVSVVCGLMVSSVALVWLYLKFGVKPEETSREMVQGLLYQQAGHQDNVYPMEVI